MESRPIFIEHELTLSEEQLNNLLVVKPLDLVGFKTTDESVRKWLKIELCRASDFDEEQEWFAMTFRCISDTPYEICGKFSIYIKSANFVTHFSDKFSNDNPNSGQEVCTIKDLFSREKKFIEDRKLTIKMKGMLFNEPHWQEHLEETLGHVLWESRDESDFVISVGKKDEPKTELKVHKLVLASHSPVFDRMLKTDMKEFAENKLEIVDFDPQIVQTAVEFFYDQDDVCFKSDAEIYELLRFSDKYDIQRLKGKIEKYVFYWLDPSNVCQYANASIVSNSTKLKDLCLRLMILYIKQEIPFDNVEILDKEFSDELLKKVSMPG